MQVKVFRAQDMKSALRKVKQAFGPNALILSTRTVRKGRFGLLRDSELEVTAAIDKKEERAPKSREKAAKDGFLDELLVQAQAVNHQDQTQSSAQPDGLPANPEQGLAAVQGAKGQDQKGQELVGLRQEIQEIRRQLGTKQTEARIQDQVRVDPESEGPEDVELLRHMGISKSAARQLVEQCPAEGLKPRGEGNGLRRCEQVLAQGLWAKDWMAESKGWPKRLALVGPTGVGKTTTIAKLAARFLKDHGRGLLLVTMDNYRVAAAEQLRVYAQIMNVPLEVVNTPEQMQATLKRHGDKRLTLIDSAGRSPWDEPGITELKDFLGDSQVFDKHLVLSATTSDQDLEAVIDRFGQVDISGLIFTKLDETREYASLVNAQFHVDCPLTYLSNGQRVPEDLFPADPAGLSELITSVQKEDNHDGQ